MIQQRIDLKCLPELVQTSRIHRANLIDGAAFYVKRDDELGFGIGGSKVRKFSSILQHILKNDFDRVILEGSLQSNNALGLAPLLSSYQIPFTLACPKPQSSAVGNRIWIEQLYDPDWVHDIPSTQGLSESDYRSTLAIKNPFIIREGAKQVESVYGLLSLAKEIGDFSSKSKIQFETIFIDAGTGITAIGLLIGLELYGIDYQQVNITLIAGTEKEFHRDLRDIVSNFNGIENVNIDVSKMRLGFLRPPTGKSFGSVNHTALNDWMQSMKKLKFPIDLTYTSKHLSSTQQFCRENPSTLPRLFINSGSWFAARNHEHRMV